MAKYDDLILEARKARKNAYAPYSKFTVGAAILCKSGKIYNGCNVENASLGLTVCAERNAVASAIAHGEKAFEAIAVVCKKMETPCGACRQVLEEFMEQSGTDLKVILVNQNGDKTITKLSKLLPRAFGPKELFEKPRKWYR